MQLLNDWQLVTIESIPASPMLALRTANQQLRFCFTQLLVHDVLCLELVKSQPCLMSYANPCSPRCSRTLEKRGGENNSATATELCPFSHASLWARRQRYSRLVNVLSHPSTRDMFCSSISCSSTSFSAYSPEFPSSSHNRASGQSMTLMMYCPAEFFCSGRGSDPSMEIVSASKSNTARRLFIVFLLSSKGASPLMMQHSIRPARS